jgi:hypothetical protein
MSLSKVVLLRPSADLAQVETDAILKGKRLVFVVGAPRSGTTWLQLLLSRSPAVATAPETHLFNLSLRSMVDEWNRIRITGERIGLNQVLSDQEFQTLLRNTSGFIFARIAQRKPSATVILEKTPNHVNCWREILDLWPDAHFIHIIRDPRSVVASLRVASKTWASQWASSRITPNCERWIADVTNGRQIRRATQNYQEVPYQELISNGPEAVMRILGGLGVTSSLDDCQCYVDECNIENLKAGKLNNAPFDVAGMGRESFRIGTNDSWRIELSTWEIALVERLTGPLMSELGFEPAPRSLFASAMSRLVRTVDRSRGATGRWLRSRLKRRRPGRAGGA